MSTSSRRAKWRHTDLILCALLLVSAAAFAMAYLRNIPHHNDGRDGLTPSHFGASVMLASGRGFVNPIGGAAAELDAFLAQQRNSFDPSTLPKNIQVIDDDPFAACHRYLFSAIGLVWRLAGISWDNLRILLVIFFCLTAAAAYGVFRLGMNPVLSAFFTACFMTSPALLDTFPYLRDFCKAFFFLLILFVLGKLLLTPLKRRALWILAALLGLVIGVGLGFRQDLLITLPPAFAVLLLGLPAGSIRDRVCACLLLALCFLLPAWPVLSVMRQQGPLSYHHIATGLATPCESALPVDPASYDRIYSPNDPVVHATYTSYAHRVQGVKESIPPWKRAAAQAAQGFVREVMRTFPADMLARGYAATLWALGISPAHVVWFEVGSPELVQRIIAWEAPVREWILPLMKYLVPTALLLLSLFSVRLALALFLLLLYFCGYTSLQFQARHCFHLAIVSFWFVGFLLDVPVKAVLSLRTKKARFSPREALHAVCRLLSFVAVGAFLVIVPLQAARAWQHRTVSAIADACRKAVCEPLPIEESNAAGKALFRLPGKESLALADLKTESIRLAPALAGQALPPFLALPAYACFATWPGWTKIKTNVALLLSLGHDPNTEYLMAEFLCDSQAIPIDLVFASNGPSDGFSQGVVARAAPFKESQHLRYFFPVYEYPAGAWQGRSIFQGIALLPQDRAKLKGLYRVKNLKDFRLLLNLSLTEDPADFRCFQPLSEIP